MPDDPTIMPPPQPTGNLWGNMLGIGPLLRLVNDPELAAKAQLAIQAIIDNHAAIVRIEQKLDQLLGASAHASPGRNDLAALPARVPNGAGGYTAASATVDDGSRGDTARPGAAGDAVGDDGGGDRTGGAVDRRGAA